MLDNRPCLEQAMRMPPSVLRPSHVSINVSVLSCSFPNRGPEYFPAKTARLETLPSSRRVAISEKQASPVSVFRRLTTTKTGAAASART